MNQRHTLLALGLAALVSVALAIFAVNRQAESAAPAQTGEFLPGFAGEVDKVASIHILSKDGDFTLVYSPDEGWVLPGRGDYPADFDEVRHTLIGLAALETIAPKTANPAWFSYIGVEMPPKGSGVLIEVADKAGRKLASLILGNMENLGDPNGTAGLFVRRPGENQSWLVRAVFVPHGDAASWMALHVLDIAPARLKSVTVTPPAGKPYTLSRANMSDLHYALSPRLPKADPQAIDAIPAAIGSLTAEDAAAAKAVDFSKASHVAAESFDGLLVSVDLTQSGGATWARIHASAKPGAVPGIAAEADAINARAGAWVYKLPAGKARLFTAPESDLVGSTP